MDQSEQKIRANGLQRPYSPAQVSTWVFLPALLAEFALLASPLMSIAISIPVTAVVFLFAGVATYYAYATMTVDPADVRIFSNPYIKRSADIHYDKPEETDDPSKHCWICQADVLQTSMHCKFCNKCVEGFDHHCMCKLRKYPLDLETKTFFFQQFALLPFILDPKLRHLNNLPFWAIFFVFSLSSEIQMFTLFYHHYSTQG